MESISSQSDTTIKAEYMKLLEQAASDLTIFQKQQEDDVFDHDNKNNYIQTLQAQAAVICLLQGELEKLGEPQNKSLQLIRTDISRIANGVSNIAEFGADTSNILLTAAMYGITGVMRKDIVKTIQGLKTELQAA